MDFLYIFMNHICPSVGALIALGMFASPLKAVLRADKEKDLGVRGTRQIRQHQRQRRTQGSNLGKLHLMHVQHHPLHTQLQCMS